LLLLLHLALPLLGLLALFLLEGPLGGMVGTLFQFLELLLELPLHLLAHLLLLALQLGHLGLGLLLLLL
jgi:hypothetical protein